MINLNIYINKCQPLILFGWDICILYLNEALGDSVSPAMSRLNDVAHNDQGDCHTGTEEVTLKYIFRNHCNASANSILFLATSSWHLASTYFIECFDCDVEIWDYGFQHDGIYTGKITDHCVIQHAAGMGHN